MLKYFYPGWRGDGEKERNGQPRETAEFCFYAPGVADLFIYIMFI